MSRWSSDPGRAPHARHRPRGPGPALLASLALHALLLSLTFGSEGLGLPGLALPWQARRAEVPDLRVVLVAPPAPPAPPAPLEQAEPDTTPAPSAAPTHVPGPAADADASLPPGDNAPAPRMLAAPDTVAAPALIAVDKAAAPRWTVPTALPASAPVVAAFEAASSPATELTRLRAVRDAALERPPQARSTDLAQLDRARSETLQLADDQARQAQRLAAAQAEAERQAAARQAAEARAAEQRLAEQQLAEQKVAEQKAAEQKERAAARAEAARLDAERQDAARRLAAQQEAARREAAQAGQAAQAAQADAARQEAGRQEAARQQAQRQDAARAQAASLAEAQAAEAQREARLRAIGRQLDEEAARRDAARQAQANLPSSWSTLRRGRLFGRADANAEMVLYAEAWARKLQLGSAFDLIRDTVRQPHTEPLVTVAIRADGTVESVTFVRSSGVAAVDDAVRRLIEAQANYPAFPPALAREYDVIEIRRTWHFDSALRLY